MRARNSVWYHISMLCIIGTLPSYFYKFAFMNSVYKNATCLYKLLDSLTARKCMDLLRQLIPLLCPQTNNDRFNISKEKIENKHIKTNSAVRACLVTICEFVSCEPMWILSSIHMTKLKELPTFMTNGSITLNMVSKKTHQCLRMHMVRLLWWFILWYVLLVLGAVDSVFLKVSCFPFRPVIASFDIWLDKKQCWDNMVPRTA